MAEAEKRKVISVHPRDVRKWDYGGKPASTQDRIDAYTIYAPACHHAGHVWEKNEAKKGIAEIEEFLKTKPPKK